jgi:hypothetical protein
MKSFDLNTRKTRWTLYVGRAGQREHRHRLRLDRLTLTTNRLRTWILAR